jgi:starch synthase
VPDAIDEGVTGLLVSPEDPEDLARALEQLLDNRELALRMGRNGRERTVAHFSWEGIGERLQKTLETVIEETKLQRR